MTPPVRLPLHDPDPSHRPLEESDALRRILAEQSAHAHSPTHWVRASETRLRAAAEEFMENVGVQAVKIARKKGATIVDYNHVNDAYTKISSKNSQNSYFTIGGLLGGGAIGAATTAITSPEQGFLWLIVIIIVLSLGATAAFIAAFKA